MQIPRGDTVLAEGDIVILGAESIHSDKEIELKEIEVKDGHDWNGVKIKDLDISRQSFIVMIRRKKKTVVPNGDITLRAGDVVYMYSNHSRIRA